MDEAAQNKEIPVHPAKPGWNPFEPFQPERALRVLFAISWMSILIGLGVQLCVLTTKFIAGAVPQAAQVFMDFAGGVSWSFIVCAGVAIGTVAAKRRAEVMGLLGLISAPLAWAAAKGAQRGTAWMLGQASETLGPLVVQVGAVKTAEYALLGFMLGRLIRTPKSTLKHHVLLGLAAGAVFGGLILSLHFLHAPAAGLPLPKLLGVSVNELVFPIGCSLAIYFIARLSDQRAALERAVAGGG